jgi:rubrerythrin
MSTTLSIFDLIDQSEFSNEDPFEINQNLFPTLKTALPNSFIKKLEAECYSNWLNWAFEGESSVSVVYKILQNQIATEAVNYFSHLTAEEKQHIHSYFDDIVAEEREHRLIFKNIIDKLQLPADITHNPDFFDPDSEEFNSFWNMHYNKVGFLSALGIAVIGESYLLACFLLFYKQSTNEAKKIIFKQFLTEESQHISKFLNLIKRGRYSDADRDRLHHSFLQTIQEKVQFETKKVNSVYQKLQDSFNKTVVDKGHRVSILNDVTKFNQLAYSGELHESFKELFLRRSYHFYNAVFPDVTEEAFLDLVHNYQTDTFIGSE